MHGIRVIDVRRDEQIQPSVAIEVEKRASRIPARAGQGKAAPARDVTEGAVAVVAIEDLLSVIGDEQIDATVVVVVAGADALSPAAAADASLFRHVGERAVAVVAIQMARWLRVGGGGAEARAVYQKDVGPPVIVEVENRGAAARCLDDVR